MSSPKLGPLIYAFFEDQLKCQKGLRPASIRSYSDALRLFLLFVASDTRRKLSRISLTDLTSERVRRFLNFLEQKRHNQVRTRNHRLAAIRTFFDYLATREPTMIAEAQQVAAIPVKRTSPPQTLYLEHDEINDLFSSLPSSGPFALRDHALLLFLYNTGARVQEVADLRVAHLELRPQPRVRLHGKGDKWRMCPLWVKTASLLRQLIENRSHPQSPQDPVFTSRNGSALTRFGIYKIVRRHTVNLMKKGSDGQPRTISPHIFRHTTAVHLLEAEVEANVIRAWLGHVSLETTNRYAEVNIRMKAEALKTCEPPVNISQVLPNKPVWRDDLTLLNWLQSL
jgi:site-specific recombinase XerD